MRTVYTEFSHVTLMVMNQLVILMEQDTHKLNTTIIDTALHIHVDIII